jgi:2,3-bisphosphoglycerate-independent phosphoglycerate mutase
VRIIFIFIDGLGIGEHDLIKNPCAQAKITLFNFFQTDSFPKKMLLDGVIKPIDAQLGVPGLPQSATGQAALFTGINAAKLLSTHLSGFPNQALRELLAKHSIHIKLKNMGKHPAFINVYRPIFFEKGPEALLRFLSVTSIANWKADLQFFDVDHLLAEQAIYHDFTNMELIKRGIKVPLFSAEQAGKILARASRNYDFCLYEYFKTDWAGHAQDINYATQLIIQLESFITTLITNTDLSNTLILVTSDHGNIEDLSVKTHTSNPVPIIAWGKKQDELLAKTKSLIDVTPALLALIKGTE